MQTRHPHPRIRPLAGWVCWCLLIALPIYGFSTVATALLGSAHFHDVTVTVAVGSTLDDPMAGWQDLRRVNHVSDAAVHGHVHSALKRHHHEASDASVVTLGVGEQGDSADTGTASASALLVFALAPAEPALKPRADTATARWNPPRDCSFASSETRLSERPPNA